MPLGVIECFDGRVVGYREKPRVTCEVSMGIYVYERRALDALPPEGPCHVPDLVIRLLDAGEIVHPYHSDAQARQRLGDWAASAVVVAGQQPPEALLAQAARMHGRRLALEARQRDRAVDVGEDALCLVGVDDPCCVLLAAPIDLRQHNASPVRSLHSAGSEVAWPVRRVGSLEARLPVTIRATPPDRRQALVSHSPSERASALGALPTTVDTEQVEL